MIVMLCFVQAYFLTLARVHATIEIVPVLCRFYRGALKICSVDRVLHGDSNGTILKEK